MNVATLVACAPDDKNDPPTVDDGGAGGGGTEGEEPKPEVIVVPEYKDYGRKTINFKDIVYARPDIDAIKADFARVCEVVRANELSFEEQVALIEEIEPGYIDLLTMYSYLNIMTSIDSSDEHWAEEYEYVSTGYPAFAQGVEDLFVAAATSPHAQRFEDEYFGEGLIEEYADGGSYTDTIVSLMENEASLEAQYNGLSTATVEITYGQMSGTYDEVVEMCKELYGETSSKYKQAKNDCDFLYENECKKISRTIFVDLIKVRKLLATEFGDESYSTYAYETIYHDYSEEDALKFINDVVYTVLPVYFKLSEYVFGSYSSTIPESLNKISLINNGYEIIKAADVELGEIYAYMLQHGLYDVEKSSFNRFEGAFTTYMEGYEAPFVFISSSGDVSDYMTLFHEFGHFADNYLNYGSSTSLDLSEVSSQSLELLSLTLLKDKLDDKSYKYLLYSEIENALLTLVFQGFYALFEHKAYAIEYDDISVESLNAAVSSAASAMGLNTQYYNDITDVFIPHIFLYPFYVQSYATSISVSLDVYLSEIETEGRGFEIYKNLLTREEETLTFEEYLEEAGLSSPFEEDGLKNLMNRLHFSLLGSYYFKTSTGNDNAA